jgi:hypothetical protein
MGGKASRDKGGHYERLFAKQITALGIPTRRVIGSGAHARYDKRLAGDLQIGVPLVGEGIPLLQGEVKYRRTGSGFKTLEGWLGDNDVLLLRRANTSPTVVLEWNTFTKLLSALWEKEQAEEGTSGSS